jgi:hypothetical protein
MIAQLVIIVCLATAPGVCREESPPMDDGASCMIQGQQVASHWLEDHPSLVLKGWRCRYGRPERKA